VLNMSNESNYETLHLSGGEALLKIRELLKPFRSVMMVTTNLNGDLHSRPMGIQGEASEFHGTLWFFTDRHCRKVEEIQANGAISLIFQSDADSVYLHLYGNAAMDDDRARMKLLYTPILRTWFPGGEDDPNMTLIRFDLERGNFWDSPGGMLQVLAAFTKAVVTGERGQGGEMGEVRL